jgi:ABC-type transporter Mla subunit MlaD
VSTVKDALDQARSEAQDLHKKIEAGRAKDHAALKAEVQDSANKAQQLAASLKSVIDGQRDDAKQHVKDAAAHLDDAAKHARDLASANDAQLKAANQAMLSKVRDAAENLSRAIASRRTTAAAK